MLGDSVRKGAVDAVIDYLTCGGRRRAEPPIA